MKEREEGMEAIRKKGKEGRRREESKEGGRKERQKKKYRIQWQGK